MTDITELCKRLRSFADKVSGSNHWKAALLIEAATALREQFRVIEELERDRDYWRDIRPHSLNEAQAEIERLDGMVAEYCNMSTDLEAAKSINASLERENADHDAECDRAFAAGVETGTKQNPSLELRAAQAEIERYKSGITLAHITAERDRLREALEYIANPARLVTAEALRANARAALGEKDD